MNCTGRRMKRYRLWRENPRRDLIHQTQSKGIIIRSMPYPDVMIHIPTKTKFCSRDRLTRCAVRRVCPTYCLAGDRGLQDGEVGDFGYN